MKIKPPLLLVMRICAFGLILLFLTGCSTPIIEGVHTGGEFVQVEEIIIGLLLVSAVVSLVAQRLRIPYTVGLVLVGFGLTLLGRTAVPNITSELILVILVPPLVFEAAFLLQLDDLFHELPLVLVLAIPGVVLTTLLVGGLVTLTAGIPIAVALVFGSLIAATDPVAVVALFRRGVPFAWKHIFFWGGLRGAISLALALSLPIDLPFRDQLQAMAFGVVLFTLLVEGLTMKPLIKFTGIIQTSSSHFHFELRHGRAVAMLAAQSRLEELSNLGLISEYTWNNLKPLLKKRTQKATEELQRTLENDPFLHQEEMADAWREMLQVQRASIISLFRDHVLSDEAYSELISEVDFMLTDSDRPWPELADKEEEEYGTNE